MSTKPPVILELDVKVVWDLPMQCLLHMYGCVTFAPSLQREKTKEFQVFPVIERLLQT